MVDFKLHDPPQGRWTTAPTNAWIISSPSTHRWGRRVFFYDVYCSLGNHEHFKWLSGLILYILVLGELRLHNRKHSSTLLSSSDETTSSAPPSTEVSQTPSSAETAPLLMSMAYTIRLIAFGLLFLSYQLEIWSAISRMRLVE